jgi:Zn-dependent protease with chaperone function
MRVDSPLRREQVGAQDELECRMRVAAAALLILALPLVAEAQTPARSPEPPVSLTDRTAPLVAPASEPEEPVAVPEPTEKALRYYRSGFALWLFNVAWGIAIPLVFLFTGFSARIRDLAQWIGRKWFFTVALYLVFFTLASFVIDLPLAYYQEFVRQHAYGLSNQTLSKWVGDSLKGLGVGLVMGVLFGWIPFFFLKMSPRRWWLYTSLISVPLIYFVFLIVPIWIHPLFNKFGPMKDKSLETEILALAKRAGIEGGRVYEVDKSVDTKAVNAYVTGLGHTKRIVLWDTIIAKLEPRELMPVMGHEMGHFVLGHVHKRILLASLTVFLSLYVAHRSADGLIRRHRARFGFDRLSDVAALPLIILLTNGLALAVSPIFLAYSRHIEHEADRFGLEITRDNHAAATAFVKLQYENLGVPRPHPLVVFLRSSHPPLGDRIDFANNYRPWETGAPLRYDALFKSRPSTRGDRLVR